MDIRKVALVTFVASILSLLAPAWNLTQTIVGIEARLAAQGWWLIPATLFSVLSTAILPVFFFALYRNEGTLRVPRPMRLLSKAAAIVLGLFVVAAVRIEFLDLGLTARGGLTDGWARTIGYIASLLSTFSNAALLFLLVSFNLHNDEESAPDVPSSQLLDQVTKVAVVFYGLVLAFLAIRVFLTPYTYLSLKSVALQNGHTLPPLSFFFEEAIRTLALQACVFAAPYVIFKSQPPPAIEHAELYAGYPAVFPPEP